MSYKLCSGSCAGRLPGRDVSYRTAVSQRIHQGVLEDDDVRFFRDHVGCDKCKYASFCASNSFSTIKDHKQKEEFVT